MKKNLLRLHILFLLTSFLLPPSFSRSTEKQEVKNKKKKISRAVLLDNAASALTDLVILSSDFLKEVSSDQEKKCIFEKYHINRISFILSWSGKIMKCLCEDNTAFSKDDLESLITEANDYKKEVCSYIEKEKNGRI